MAGNGECRVICGLSAAFFAGPFWDNMPYSPGKLFLWLLWEAIRAMANSDNELASGKITPSLRYIRESLRWNNPVSHTWQAPAFRTVLRDLEALEKAEMIAINREKTLVAEITICKTWFYPAFFGDPDSSGLYSTYCTSLLKVQPSPLGTSSSSTVFLPDKEQSGKKTPVTSKKPLAEKMQELKDSPHWPFYSRFCAWFYGPENAYTPEWKDLSPEDRYRAVYHLDKIVVKDMADQPEAEERIERVVRWALADSFWAGNTQAIPPLRKKEDGLFKWQRLETKMSLSGFKRVFEDGDFERLIEEGRDRL